MPDRVLTEKADELLTSARRVLADLRVELATVPATSDDAAAKTSGGLWYHRARQKPAPQSLEPRFQDELMEKLAELTGVKLF